MSAAVNTMIAGHWKMVLKSARARKRQGRGRIDRFRSLLSFHSSK
jgi:hypothetical protein